MNAEDAISKANESKNFWSGLWNCQVEHNVNAEWLNDIESDLKDIRKQDDIKICFQVLEKQLRRIPNWKAPGPDGVQGH